MTTCACATTPALTKNQRIAQSRQKTKEKRKTQAIFVAKVKVVEDHLSTQQRGLLNRVFLEAKWLKNDMVSFTANEDNSIDNFDTKSTRVSVKMGKDSDKYESREYEVLSSSSRQKIRDVFKSNIKSISSNKKNGRITGKIGYVKEMNVVPLKQYNRDYKIISPHHVQVTKIGRMRVRGLAQIPQDADIANAELIRKPDGYYIHIHVYLPLVYNADIMSREDVGIDFGIKKSLTTSHGEEFDVFVPETPRLKRLQRALSRAKRKSSNWLKILHKIHRENQKMINLKEESANQIVHYLLNKYRFIYIQDENISGWRGLFGEKVHHSILGRVKAKLVSHPRVIVLKRSVPTTQFCPECYALNKMPLDERTYTCSCGYVNHRDIHAAENMMTMAHLFPEMVKKSVDEEKVSVERADYKRLPG